MDDFEEKDDNKRKSRNASEKKRRDQFNILVTELGTMVSHNRKMDKTTVLKATIAFLKQQNETSTKSQLHEIKEDWKPSFLSNEEFTHLMLEALEGFILVFNTDGSILYVSDSVTSLLGYLPKEVVSKSMYDLIPEKDRGTLFNCLAHPTVDTFQGVNSSKSEKHMLLHLKKGRFGSINSNNNGLDMDDESQRNENDVYELVKVSGHFRKWMMSDSNLAAGSSVEGGSDDETLSLKSGISRLSNQELTVEKTVFVGTVRLQTTQLLREMPLVQSSSKSEFSSRYSLEWKFMFLDHRAPQIIGYLPFELLGTSGYDYYHMDDLDRISQCHEALMNTGEGTSCIHRFLSKGQQWIWLQTRYYITYHQWNSKPEFIVATHKVVSYSDVLKEIRSKNKPNMAASSRDNLHDPGGSAHHYPTVVSPTSSSRSSLCDGGGNSSTGTGASSKLSEHNRSHQRFSFRDGGDSEEYFSNTDYDNIGQFLPSQKERSTRSVVVQNALQPPAVQGQVQPTAARTDLETVSVAGTSSLRPQVAMTPAQLQLQEQLRLKHTELTKRIAEQQEELGRISEQLLMSQYGLVPVSVSLNETVPISSPCSRSQATNGIIVSDTIVPASCFITTPTSVVTSQQFDASLAPETAAFLPRASSASLVMSTFGSSPSHAQGGVYTSITSDPDQYTNGELGD